MTSTEPAAITGIGLVTPAGVGRAVNWTAIRQGRSTAATVDAIKQAPVDFASTVPDTFAPNRLAGKNVTRPYDRSTQFALVAANAALSEAGLTPSARADARVGIVIGTAFGGVQTVEDNHTRLLEEGPSAVTARFLPKGLVNMVAGSLAIELGATGPAMVVSTACASGATALGTALGMLRANQCDIVVAGGTDASVTPLHMAGFHKLRALSRGQHPPEHASRPFDTGHDGFVMGEGAAMMVLERDQQAHARQAHPYARLAGYGTTADAHHVTAPHPDGTGARTAIDLACRDAESAPTEVGHVNAHATSTPTGDAIEANVLAAVTPNAAVTSTKGTTGHTMGAAGAIEAAYTALALRDQITPPIANLTTPCEAASQLNLAHEEQPGTFHTAISTSFGFGGHNAVLALTT